MCNLSLNISEEALNRGLAQGRKEGRAEGRAEGRLAGLNETFHGPFCRRRIKGYQSSSGNCRRNQKTDDREK